MLDINFVRKNPEKIKEVLKVRNFDINLDELLDLDQTRRELILKVDVLRQQRNVVAKEKNIEKGKQIKDELDGLEDHLREIEKKFNNLLLQLPNIPLDDVPVGKDASENKVLRKWGEIKELGFKVKDHVELGEKLDIIDIETAGKVSGSRFAYLKNEAVLLQFALINFVFKTLADDHKLAQIAEKVGLEVNPKPF